MRLGGFVGGVLALGCLASVSLGMWGDLLGPAFSLLAGLTVGMWLLSYGPRMTLHGLNTLVLLVFDRPLAHMHENAPGVVRGMLTRAYAAGGLMSGFVLVDVLCSYGSNTRFARSAGLVLIPLLLAATLSECLLRPAARRAHQLLDSVE